MPKKDKDRKVERSPNRRASDPALAAAETNSPELKSLLLPASRTIDREGDGGPAVIIVGIGASASGLKAFRNFLEAVPPRTGMAFMLVPHVDPTHENLMVELLSQRTTMPLQEAKEGTRVQADHVYVIPPNKYMEIREGRLHLVTPGEPPPTGNRIDGVAITFMDITDRKRQETELNQAYAGLEAEVSRRTSALSMIRDMAVQANAARSVEEILEVSLRRICDYVGWESGYAYCSPRDEDDEDDLGLVPAASWNNKMTRETDWLRSALSNTPLTSGEDMASRAWRTGEPQWSPDLGRDLPVPVAEAAAKLGFDSAYAYPVVSNRRVVALLLFLGKNLGKSLGESLGRNLGEPQPQTVELLSSIANHISLVVERERLSRQIHEMSAYDQIRLSQDLHDAIGQQLAGLSMSAEVITRTLAQKGSDEAPAMAEVVQGLRETLQQIRLLARGLAEIPVGPGALAIALEQLCMSNPTVLHSSLKCKTNVDRTVDIEDPDVAIHLYRIAQEAVHNAVNHSHGKQLQVSLQQNEQAIVMSIQDDGIGLAKTPRAGMGLRTMRHRARLIGATLEVRSERGTRIIVRVPKGDES